MEKLTIQERAIANIPEWVEDFVILTMNIKQSIADAINEKFNGNIESFSEYSGIDVEIIKGMLIGINNFSMDTIHILEQKLGIKLLKILGPNE